MAGDTGEGTVGKALEVMDLVAAARRPVRYTELVPKTRFPKTTLYRLLQTLTKAGMLGYDDERQTYSLGVRLVRLAHTAWRQSSLAPIARPHVEALSRVVGETVHLAQLDHGQVLYVDKRNAYEPIEMFSQAGKVGPAYCTGVGKAMIAFLPEEEREKIISLQAFHQFTPATLASPEALRDELNATRARGYAMDKEEHEPSIICIAAPVLGETGRVLGGLSVTSSTDRCTLSDLERHVSIIRQTAGSIASEAESWRFPDADAHTRGN